MKTTSSRKSGGGLGRILFYGALSTALLMTLYAGNVLLEAQGLALDNESIWYAVRSSGIVAYLLLAASTAWGLLLSSKLARRWASPALALELHTYLSWTAIGMTVYHAYLLLFSDYFDFGVIDLLLPFVGPYEPLAVGMGILGVYLMILTSASFYVIQRIGYKVFRAVHYLTYAAFVLATAHSWLAGTDSALLNPLYLAVSVGVLWLTLLRVLAASRRAQEIAREESKNSQPSYTF
jgi:predicted ferric reductase